MILPSTDQGREAGLTLWLLGWLSGLPCLASPGADPGWAFAALLSLALVAAGLHLVLRAGTPREVPR